MNSTKRSQVLAALALALSTLGLAASVEAQTFKPLASLSVRYGSEPLYGSLVQATNGKFYGTTHEGGKHGKGVVFEVALSGKFIDIYSFCSQSQCSDGSEPWSALVLGRDGILYGTTNVGGNYNSGTVFKITVEGKLTTLYSFCPQAGCVDGQFPVGLTQASDGNFYGTTSNAGAKKGGTLFQVTPAGKFKVLYSFSNNSSPVSGPMQASNGSFYGTTYDGGYQGAGSVYEFTPTGRFRTLYNFCSQTNCMDGQNPFGSLTPGPDGTFYGTTQLGGAYGDGTVFAITRSSQLTTLHSFDHTDGDSPVAALVQASDGNYYGTTNGGGGDGGTIYQITSAGEFSSLFDFCSIGCVGAYPGYALLQTTNGAFIGVTTAGGNDLDGTIFSYAIGLGPLVETVPNAAKAGARVIILGNGLTGSTSVLFNGTAAAFTVVSDTEITATVPTGATTGKVAVTTPTGTLYSNPVFQVME